MESQVRAIAEKYLKHVRPSGSDSLRAHCPFHSSRSASRSFIISLRNGMWLCYSGSCGERGSLVYLLRRLGLTREQVDRVLRNMSLPPPLPTKLRKRAEINDGWSLLPEYVLGAYEKCPTQLLEAGFDMDLLRRNDVGWDETNNRITFAIRDYLGRLTAISGRASEDWVIPRYKVYDAAPPIPAQGKPAGAFYGIVNNYTPTNRRHLYGFSDVFPERYFKPAETHPPLVVVEGYKAALWCRQEGLPHTVALQGSSLSPSQRRWLTRLRGPYYVLLDHEPGKGYPDPDKKGFCAAVNIAKALSKSGRALICRYPEDAAIGTSPDDLDQDQLKTAINNAKTIAQIMTERRPK